MAFFTKISKLQYAVAIVSVCSIPAAIKFFKNEDSHPHLNVHIPMNNPKGDRRFHEHFSAGEFGGVGERYKSGSGWDVREDSEAVYLKLELPGIGKDELRITLEKNSLVIKGGPEDKLGFSGGMEMPPNCCDLDSITANMKNGILIVTVPKAKYHMETAVSTSSDLKHITVD